MAQGRPPPLSKKRERKDACVMKNVSARDHVGKREGEGMGDGRKRDVCGLKKKEKGEERVCVRE